jgi:hypothetical protein
MSSCALRPLQRGRIDRDDDRARFTYGNGCSACGTCQPREMCGKDLDDDCDGMTDEGCPRCSDRCGVGEVCHQTNRDVVYAD